MDVKQYIAALRATADFYEVNPTIPLPFKPTTALGSRSQFEQVKKALKPVGLKMYVYSGLVYLTDGDDLLSFCVDPRYVADSVVAFVIDGEIITERKDA